MGVLSDNLPVGCENNPEAPWNQTDNPDKVVEVTVSVTLSKTIKIKVNDYNIVDSGKDEDGNYFEEIDYSDCDLKKAVKEQYLLPQGYLLKGWTVDDFEVVLE